MSSRVTSSRTTPTTTIPSRSYRSSLPSQETTLRSRLSCPQTTPTHWLKTSPRTSSSERSLSTETLPFQTMIKNSSWLSWLETETSSNSRLARTEIPTGSEDWSNAATKRCSDSSKFIWVPSECTTLLETLSSLTLLISSSSQTLWTSCPISQRTKSPSSTSTTKATPASLSSTEIWNCSERIDNFSVTEKTPMLRNSVSDCSPVVSRPRLDGSPFCPNWVQWPRKTLATISDLNNIILIFLNFITV